MDKKIKTIAEMIGEYKYGSWQQMPFQNQIVAENLAKKIDALYSDPPSPEPPEKVRLNKKKKIVILGSQPNHALIKALNDLDKIDPLNSETPNESQRSRPKSGDAGFICGNSSKNPPSPEPPEKVRLTESEKAEILSMNSPKVIISAVEKLLILKLQQAGWGNVSGKDAEIAELERVLDNWRKLATERYDKNREQEARIKELEYTIKMLQKINDTKDKELSQFKRGYQPE